MDGEGNIWVSGSSSGACYAELNHSGTVITPASTSAFCTSIGSGFDALAPDGSGNAWALGFDSIGKVNSSGTLAATAATSQGCFDSDYNEFTTTQVFDAVTTDLRYDRVNNHLWGLSLIGAGTITDAGTANFCDVAAGTTNPLPLIAEYSTTSTTPGDPFSEGGLLLTSGVLDGAGNLWFTSGGVAATGTVGSASETFNGTVTYSSWLGEISPSGTLLSPFNATTSTYGYQPSGLGSNVTATSCRRLDRQRGGQCRIAWSGQLREYLGGRHPDQQIAEDQRTGDGEYRELLRRVSAALSPDTKR